MKADLSGYGSRTWTTKGGTEMKWSEMTISHLRNTARMLERRGAEISSSLWSAYCFVQGEQASLALESAIDQEDEAALERAAYIRQMNAYASWRETVATKR